MSATPKPSSAAGSSPIGKKGQPTQKKKKKKNKPKKTTQKTQPVQESKAKPIQKNKTKKSKPKHKQQQETPEAAASKSWQHHLKMHSGTGNTSSSAKGKAKPKPKPKPKPAPKQTEPVQESKKQSKSPKNKSKNNKNKIKSPKTKQKTTKPTAAPTVPSSLLPSKPKAKAASTPNKPTPTTVDTVPPPHLTPEQINQAYKAAKDVWGKISQKRQRSFHKQDQTRLYGLYKYIEVGPPFARNAPQNPTKEQSYKWNAWSTASSTCKTDEEAMYVYSNLVFALTGSKMPKTKQNSKNGKSGKGGKGGGESWNKPPAAPVVPIVAAPSQRDSKQVPNNNKNNNKNNTKKNTNKKNTTTTNNNNNNTTTTKKNNTKKGPKKGPNKGSNKGSKKEFCLADSFPSVSLQEGAALMSKQKESKPSSQHTKNNVPKINVTGKKGEFTKEQIDLRTLLVKCVDPKQTAKQMRDLANAVATNVAQVGVTSLSSARLVDLLRDHLLTSKDKVVRECGVLVVAALVEEFGFASIGSMINIVPLVLGLTGDKKGPNVRAAAAKVTLAMFELLPNAAVPVYVKQVLLDGKNAGLAPLSRPETKVTSLQLLSRAALKAPQQIEKMLVQLVPIVSKAMWDVKKVVKEQAEDTLGDVAGAMDNIDIEPFIPQLVDAIADPELVPDIVYALAGTTFVQTVTASALSLTVPLLKRGFNDKKTGNNVLLVVWCPGLLICYLYCYLYCYLFFSTWYPLVFNTSVFFKQQSNVQLSNVNVR